MPAGLTSCGSREWSSMTDCQGLVTNGLTAVDPPGLSSGACKWLCPAEQCKTLSAKTRCCRRPWRRSVPEHQLLQVYSVEMPILFLCRSRIARIHTPHEPALLATPSEQPYGISHGCAEASSGVSEASGQGMSSLPDSCSCGRVSCSCGRRPTPE